jgi:acetyl-CoA synthetase
MRPTDAFRRARDVLLAHRDDLDAAARAFRWPALETFNWALDWSDEIARGDLESFLEDFSIRGS